MCSPCSPLPQFSSVLDLKNLHGCLDEVIKSTEEISCDKTAPFSGNGKTFWATLLEVVSLHSHFSERAIQFPAFGKTQTLEPVCSQMG